MSTHPVEPRPEGRANASKVARTGLSFRRYFTKPGRHPYDELAWESRSAVINDERGQPVFEQHGIEVPTTWSQTATNIVASKYFRGALQLAPAGAEREAADLAGGRLDPGLGRGAGLLRDPRRPAELQRRADPPPRAAEGGLQQPRLVQRGDREAPAGLGLLHQRRQRHHGVDPRPGQDRGHALQVRLGHGLEPLEHPLQQGAAGRRRHRVGPGVVHARVRRLRGRDQERGQDPPRGQDGDPERRPPRHRRVHQLQGRGGAEGLGPHRRGLRGLLQREGRGLRLRLLPERQPLRARHRRLHARGGRRPRVADEVRDLRGQLRRLPRPRPHEDDGGSGLAVRRSRDAVRHHHQRLAHLPEHGADQRLEPLQRVHVPRRHGLQPVLLEPHEVPQGRRGVRHRGLQGGLPHHDHRPGDPGRQRELPHAGHRPQLPRLPSPRPRVRQPRRAAHGPRPALRQRRGPRLRGRHHRPHARRGLRAKRAGGLGHGPLRGLRQERRAHAAGHRQAPPARPHGRLHPGAA